MRNRIGADVDSFSQTASPFRYLQLLVLVGIKRRKLHGVVVSVSCAPHQMQHRGMRTTRVVAFWSFFVAQIEDSGFSYPLRSLLTTNSKNWRDKPLCVRNKNGTFCGQDFFGTFDHKLKVGRVLHFLELAPQTVLHYGTKTGRFVEKDFSGLWP